jgi:hypothetical protein
VELLPTGDLTLCPATPLDEPYAGLSVCLHIPRCGTTKSTRPPDSRSFSLPSTRDTTPLLSLLRSQIQQTRTLFFSRESRTRQPPRSEDSLRH